MIPIAYRYYLLRTTRVLVPFYVGTNGVRGVEVDIVYSIHIIIRLSVVRSAVTVLCTIV